ncbi:hypothetical protein [Azonexus sp. R2A61]|uniref:hypothetical protein n=1 Tax=Azonexus sp. R2A61 TaxID=2744443 RepID=UPI001F413EA3|nr:hypothetical protein [Azonexus sp. R2A61]
MSKQLLIARVKIITMIDGERVEIPAGDPLPENLNEHDIRELKKLRAIEDVAESANAEKDSAKAAAVAGKAFTAARQAVQAAAESIKVSDAETPPGGESDKTDTTGSAGAAGGVGGADLKGAAAPKRQAAATKKKEG